MSPSMLAFCLSLPVVFGAIAVVTHLAECRAEQLRRTFLDSQGDLK